MPYVNVCMGDCQLEFMLYMLSPGEVLYGIQPQYPVNNCATVRGLMCSQENRDHFRVSVSSLIAHRISPSLASGTVTVHMWPVLDKVTKLPVDNLFVVGMLLALRLFS